MKKIFLFFVMLTCLFCVVKAESDPFPTELIPLITIDPVKEVINFPPTLEFRFEDSDKYITSTSIDLNRNKILQKYQSIVFRKRAVGDEEASADYYFPVPSRQPTPELGPLLNDELFDYEREYLCKADPASLDDYEYYTSSGWVMLEPYSEDANPRTCISIKKNLDKGIYKVKIRKSAYITPNGDVVNLASDEVTVKVSREKGPSTKNLVLTINPQGMEEEVFATIQSNPSFPNAIIFADSLSPNTTTYWEFDFDGPISIGKTYSEDIQWIAGRTYFIRTQADPDLSKFASKITKYKIRPLRKAPRVTYDKTNELYRGLKIGDMMVKIDVIEASTYDDLEEDFELFSDDDESTWKLLTNEVASSNAIYPDSTKKTVSFKLLPKGTKMASLETSPITLNPRAETPVYNGETGVDKPLSISIDYDKEIFKTSRQTAYRPIPVEGKKPSKWKLLKSQIFKNLIPRKEPIKYQFIEVASATLSNSLPLTIQINPRPPEVEVGAITYNYITGVYTIGTRPLYVSKDGKTIERFEPGSQFVFDNNVFCKYAAVTGPTPEESFPASSNFTKYELLPPYKFELPVTYNPEKGVAEGVMGLQFSRDSASWHDVDVPELPIPDGITYFRVPPKEDTPASKPFALKAKKSLP